MVSSSLLSMSTGMLVSGFLDWELSVDRTGSKAAEHREEQTKQIDLSTSTKMSEVLRDKKNLGLGRTPEQQEMSFTSKSLSGAIRFKHEMWPQYDPTTRDPTINERSRSYTTYENGRVIISDSKVH